MSGVTRIPDVLTALLAIAAAIPDLAAIDGEPQQGQTGDFIAVGSAQQGPGIVNLEQLTDYGMTSPMETFDVVSQIVAWQGDTDTAACRVRIGGYLASWSSALLADPSLGGVAMLAQTTATEWTQMQTTKGVMVIAQTTVRVQASRI